jgi:hypothetical protein
MRRKYVEERFKPWFVFGELPDSVDIADVDGDRLQGVPRRLVAPLLAEHDRLIDAIGDLALAFAEAAPDAFTAFWYGPKVTP